MKRGVVWQLKSTGTTVKLIKTVVMLRSHQCKHLGLPYENAALIKSQVEAVMEELVEY